MARSPQSKGLKDKAYLEWIRSLSCVVCDSQGHPQTSITEAAHVGERGLSQKCSDRETIPLCAGHHRIGVTAQHRLGKKFWEHHQIYLDTLIAGLNERYNHGWSR